MMNVSTVKSAPTGSTAAEGTPAGGSAEGGSSEGGGPEGSHPAGHELFVVPVRTNNLGALALRTGRLVNGERTGLAFTSEATLLLALGPSQQWVRLDSHALRNMLAPLGVTRIRVDPHPFSDLARVSREGIRPLTPA